MLKLIILNILFQIKFAEMQISKILTYKYKEKIEIFLMEIDALPQIIVWFLASYLTKEYILLWVPTVEAEEFLTGLPQANPNDYDDPFNHPVSFQGAWIPHVEPSIQVNDNSPDVELDGNATCEDAAYNQRDTSVPLGEANQSSPNKNLTPDVKQVTSPIKDMLSAELTEIRVDFIEMIINRTLAILKANTNASMLVDNNLVPDESIKNVTFFIVKTYGNVSEWVARTEAEIVDPYHESTLRIAIIQHIMQDNKLDPVQTKILTHLATSITLLNAAEALKISPEHFDQLFKGSFYESTYTKYYPR